MKIFDFTSGKRGELLADIPLANSMSGCLVRKGDRVFRVELATSQGKGQRWQWHAGASHPNWIEGKRQPDGNAEINPANYNAGAICFCTGQERKTGIWNWSVIGTPDWNREACRSGILVATYSHNVEPEVETCAQ